MRKFRISAYILFIISLFIKYISSKYSYIVENYYSKNIDIYIVKFLSKLNSTFSFSYFEILIYIFVLSIIISIIYLIRKGFKGKKAFFSSLKNIILNYIGVLCFIYFLFIILTWFFYNWFFFFYNFDIFCSHFPVIIIPVNKPTTYFLVFFFS